MTFQAPKSEGKKERRFHLHVYRIKEMAEMEVVASNLVEAKVKALDLFHTGEGEGEVGKWHLPDQPIIVIDFEH